MFSAGCYLQEGLDYSQLIVFASCMFCFGKLEAYDCDIVKGTFPPVVKLDWPLIPYGLWLW